MDFVQWLFTSVIFTVSGIFGVHQPTPVVTAIPADPTPPVIEQHRVLSTDTNVSKNTAPSKTTPVPVATATIDRDTLTPIISESNNFGFKITGTAHNLTTVYVAMVKSNYTGSKDYASVSTYVQSHTGGSLVALEPVANTRWAINMGTLNPDLSGTVLVYDPKTFKILASGNLHVGVQPDVQASLDAYQAAVDARDAKINQAQRERSALQSRTQQGVAAFDADTFTKTTTPTPTISGTASGVTLVSIELGNSAGAVDIHGNYPVVYSSALTPVVSGKWTVTVTPALPTGAYSISVYDADKKLLVGGGNINI